MNLKLSNKVLLLLIFSLVLAQVVNAENVFEQAFQSFGTLSPQFYEKHWWWLDLMAYAFLFIGIGQLALKGKMGDEKGKLGIIVGAILAGSLIVYELNTGFRLANMMPLALFLLAFVIGALTYHFATGMGASKVFAFSFAYTATYAIIISHASEIIDSLEEISKTNDGGAAGLLLGAMRIGLIVAALGLIYSVIKGVGSLFSGGFMGSFAGERAALEKGGELAGKAAGALRDVVRREKEEAAEETAEEKEAKRQRADLDRIRQLSQYGVKDAKGMKEAIGVIIGLIRRSKGRLAQEIYTEVNAELQSINQKGAEIQNATKTLEAVIADLEKAEYEEFILAGRAAVNARIAVESAKRAAAGGRLKRTEIDKLTKIQLAIENDAKKRAAQAWALTKKELESRKNALKAMEVEFGKLLSDAIPRINPTQYETAVQLLERAQGMLDQIAAAFKTEGGKLVGDVKNRIATELRDLKNEKGLIARINRESARP